jgi:chorismate mutase
MPVRGVRGATTVEADLAEAIDGATRELLEAMLKSNSGMIPEDLASALFTVTDDLSASFPASAARNLGWENVPLICAQEIPVPEGLPRCIRVLLHWNTDLPQSAIHHVYLGAAAAMRPDLKEKD